MDENDKNKNDDVKEFARTHWEQNAAYNAHKENMAYAGVLLQVGLFAGIMQMEQWPPSYVDCHTGLWLIGLGGIWLLIHSFIGWQLMNRRVGAKRVGAAILYLCGNRKKDCEFQKAKERKPRKLILQLLIWPLDLGYEGDIKKEDVKSEFETLFNDRKTKTDKEEWILLSGSILMLSAILARS